MRFFLTFCDWHADPIIANEVLKIGVDIEYIGLQIIIKLILDLCNAQYLGFGLFILRPYTCTFVKSPTTSLILASKIQNYISWPRLFYKFNPGWLKLFLKVISIEIEVSKFIFFNKICVLPAQLRYTNVMGIKG